MGGGGQSLGGCLGENWFGQKRCKQTCLSKGKKAHANWFGQEENNGGFRRKTFG